MKHRSWLSLAEAVSLSFLLSFGAAASMVSGLELNVESMGKLGFLLLLTCLVAALCGKTRFGSWILALFALIPAWYLLRNETAWSQLQDMLYKITRYYHRAYGWPMVNSPFRGTGPMEIPVTILGIWIGLYGGFRLSRGKGCRSLLLLASLPLIASVVVNDTVPEEKYLFLWLLGMGLTLLSSGVRREDPAWGTGAVLLAAVPMVLALSLLFWAVPREGYDKHPDELQQKILEWFQSLPDLWEQVSEDIAEKVDGTIQPETINLQKTGPRIKRVYPVMEVTAPVTGTVYLRGQHYDIYTGTGWEASRGQETFGAPRASRELGTIDIKTRSVRDVLYLPYYPDENLTLTNGAIDNGQRWKESSYIMRGLPSHWRNMLLSASSTMEHPFFVIGRAGNSEDVNLHLPEDTYRWAVETAADILSGEVTATEVADTIAKYVRNSAPYDLDTEKMPWDSTDFARWFLEDSDTGYCVHFATAATVLLRAAGVEARYVEGYMFSGRNGEEVTVTADQAHAWAEYYEPLLGTWIVLEATPADLNDDPVQTENTETETTGVPPEIPEETTKAPETEPEVPETSGKGEQTPDLPDKKPVDLSWLRWLLLPVLILGGLEGQYRLRRRIRHLRRGGRNARALYLWRQLELLCRLTKMSAPEEARILAEKAKYSRRGISREELLILEAHFAAAREKLEGQNPLRKVLVRYLFAFD